MMKKTLIASMVVTLGMTALTASAFASTTTAVNPAEQAKIQEILTKLEALERHPDQIAYEKALELQSESIDKLSDSDWNAIDTIQAEATKKQETFLATKNIPNIPQSILDAVNVDEPTEAAFDAYVAAMDTQSEAINALSESDYNTYLSFREEADKLQMEYMKTRGVKFVDAALEAKLTAVDEQMTALWNQMPESYFENYQEEGDHSDEVYANV